MTLSATALFTPMPSGVGVFGNVPAVPDPGTWLGVMLSTATTTGLPTTSWRPGDPERTIFAVQAVTFYMNDVKASLFAQGGFLQTAASGSVAFTDVKSGITTVFPVSPDPSNASQNPTASITWLDLLGQNVYSSFRLAATYASGPLAIANLKGSSIGPYVAGTYHVANTTSGATYNNPSSLTVPSSAIAGTGGQVAGVIPGVSSTFINTTSAHGLVAGNVVYLVIPASSGVSGLAGVFGLVTAVAVTSIQVAVASGGTWTSGGTVYSCTVAQMQADVAGIGSNAGPGTVTVAVTQNANVFVGNLVGWSGSNWESNAGYQARCLLALAIRSPTGPSQAFVYFAQTAQQLLSAETPAYVLTNGPVLARAFASPVTGIVTTVVASSTPASTIFGAPVTPGVAQLPVSGVTLANPAVVSCSGATGIPAGQTMSVEISGVVGVGGLVNGNFLATYVGPDSFSIPVNTSAAGAYVSGGVVEGGDLGAIDALIQQNCVDDTTISITVSALALPIVVAATVVVPQAFVIPYQLAVNAQLLTQMQSYAVGGNAPAYEVAYDDIVGALEEAGVVALGQASYVRSIQSLSLNGGANGVGVPFPSGLFQAVLATPAITVLGA